MYNGRGFDVRHQPQRRRFRLRSIFYVLAACYALSVIIGSGIGWYRLMPLRSEFMDGRDHAICRPVRHEEWRSLDCGGYYDKILAKRDQKAREMGCVVPTGWKVMNDNEPESFTVYVDFTFCWKPTFTL